MIPMNSTQTLPRHPKSSFTGKTEENQSRPLLPAEGAMTISHLLVEKSINDPPIDLGQRKQASKSIDFLKINSLAASFFEIQPTEAVFQRGNDRKIQLLSGLAECTTQWPGLLEILGGSVNENKSICSGAKMITKSRILLAEGAKEKVQNSRLLVLRKSVNAKQMKFRISESEILKQNRRKRSRLLLSVDAKQENRRKTQNSVELGDCCKAHACLGGFLALADFVEENIENQKISVSFEDYSETHKSCLDGLKNLAKYEYPENRKKQHNHDRLEGGCKIHWHLGCPIVLAGFVEEMQTLVRLEDGFKINWHLGCLTALAEIAENENNYVLIGGGRTSRTWNTQEFEIVEKGTKSMIVRLRVPNEQEYQCPISGCATQSKVGIGAAANHYMWKHMNTDHGIKLTFRYQCNICEEKCPETLRVVTRWVTAHLKEKHGIELVKTGTLSTRENIEESLIEAAPSLALKKKIANKTPEKVPLTSRPQTRSVTKQLSASKVSAEKVTTSRISALKKPEDRKPQTKLTAIKEEPSSDAAKKPRRSLAPIFKPTNSTVGRSSLAPRVPPIWDVRQEKRPSMGPQTKALGAAPTRLTTSRRPSLPTGISQRSAVRKEGGAKADEETKLAETSEKVNKAENKVEVVTVEDDGNPVKNRLNIWCLTHDEGVDAGLDSDIVNTYLENVAKQTRFMLINPILWSVYCRGPAEKEAKFITNMMNVDSMQIFPICENSHWVLIVSTPEGWYYLDPYGKETMPPRIARFTEFLRGERMRFETSPPKQRDGFNCGVHVCLMAKAIMTGNTAWYTEDDVAPKSTQNTLNNNFMRSQVTRRSE